MIVRESVKESSAYLSPRYFLVKGGSSMKKICIILTVALLAAGIFAPTASCEEAVTVIEKKGRVQVVFAGRKRPEVCMEGMELEEGTTIRTKKDSSVILAIDKTGKNLARVEELSEIILRIDSKGEIELIDGELFAVLKGMKEGTKFAIRTPQRGMWCTRHRMAYHVKKWDHHY